MKEKINSCQIIEVIKNGKYYRECSNCKTNVTTITMQCEYKYCPWCGFKITKGE